MRIYMYFLMLLVANVLSAQTDKCQGYKSDDMFLRYTAVGCQEVVNGNHSKAINESRKIAHIVAENELAKMVKSTVTMVSEQMKHTSDTYFDKYIDTTIVSSYSVFNGLKTICQSETKLVGKTYFTYVTKEISLYDIGDILFLDDKKTKKKFRKLIEKNK